MRDCESLYSPTLMTRAWAADAPMAPARSESAATAVTARRWFIWFPLVIKREAAPARRSRVLARGARKLSVPTRQRPRTCGSAALEVGLAAARGGADALPEVLGRHELGLLGGLALGGRAD